MESPVCLLALSFLLICGIHMNLAAPVVPSDKEGELEAKARALSTVDICSQITCGSTYMNITFQKNDLINLNVDLANIHFIDPVCRGFADTESTILIQSLVKEGECGTQVSTNATHAIYENAIYLAPNPSQIFYREEYFINVSCAYPLDMNVSLHTVLNPSRRILYIIIEGTGQFEVIMAAFKDQTYLTPYQTGELELSTKDRLYIGVFISKGDTQQFHIVMQQCYATPTNNPQDPIKYPIIQDSCRNKEDGTLEVYANGISSQGQFSIQMFKFINHNRVYLHCGVHLCRKTAACVPICAGLRLRSASPVAEIVSIGPIVRSDAIITTASIPDGSADTIITTVSAPDDSADTIITTASAPEDSADTIITTASTPKDSKDTIITTASTPKDSKDTIITTASTPKDSKATIITTASTSKDSAGKGTCLDALTILAALLCWRLQ
ncbi:uromodulin-like [Mixophyes fleayi]|uniref:uromodulin-like n=1 Tax=Mixophyes fleayi TaxID=3061075 RepID=UPI003F4D88F2